MDFKIKKVVAREILDSRGTPTVECDVITNSGFGRAAVPSGASTGRFEAVELRDGGARYRGKGVKRAVKTVNETIASKITGMDCANQEEIDNLMIALDGSKNKSLLGANATLAVSLAVCRAASGNSLYRHLGTLTQNHDFVLPVPFSNVINGGRHADNDLQIQEFMLVPEKFSSFNQAIAAVSETYHELRQIIAARYGRQSTSVGDEGGFSPKLAIKEQSTPASPAGTVESALQLMEEAVESAGYRSKIRFAVDAAASEFYDKENQTYEPEKRKRKLSSGELMDYYMKLIKSHDIVSLEDPFDEEDYDSFAMLTAKSGIQIVGDDLLATNPIRVQAAIEKHACNCLLLKTNQIGTLTEAVHAAKIAKKNKWNTMVSHRSGETEDVFIADLAVALGCGQIKTGAPARSDRTAKYNQLLRIEQELGDKANYGRIR